MSLPETQEKRLKDASTEYQKLQADLSNAVNARQRLDAQLSENEMVKKVNWLYCLMPSKLQLTNRENARSSPL